MGRWFRKGFTLLTFKQAYASITLRNLSRCINLWQFATKSWLWAIDWIWKVSAAKFPIEPLLNRKKDNESISSHWIIIVTSRKHLRFFHKLCLFRVGGFQYSIIVADVICIVPKCLNISIVIGLKGPKNCFCRRSLLNFISRSSTYDAFAFSFPSTPPALWEVCVYEKKSLYSRREEMFG